MEKNLKQKKGITLIALVITIIVLLILAGISITMLSGDNGILRKTTDAKTNSEKARVIEQARTDILGYQAKNNGTDLQKSQLKSVLDTYFNDVPTELPDGEELSNLELTTLEKYGTHTIKVSEIYNVNIKSNDAQEDKIIQYFMQNNYFNTIKIYDNTGRFPNIPPLNNASDVLMLNGRNISNTLISVWYTGNMDKWDLYIISYNNLQWELYTDDDNKPINVEKCTERTYLRNGDDITQNNGIIFLSTQWIYGDNQIYDDFPSYIDKDSCNAKIKIVSNGAEIDLTKYIQNERFYETEGYFECDGINLNNIPELIAYSGENVIVTMDLEGKELSWSGLLNLNE